MEARDHAEASAEALTTHGVLHSLTDRLATHVMRCISSEDLLHRIYPFSYLLHLCSTLRQKMIYGDIWYRDARYNDNAGIWETQASTGSERISIAPGLQ